MLFKRMLLIFSMVILFSISINAYGIEFDNEIFVNPFFFGKIYTLDGEQLHINNSTSISNSVFQKRTEANNYNTITDLESKVDSLYFFYLDIGMYNKVEKNNLYRFFFNVKNENLEIDENASVLFKID